jgi:DNA-binding CsgD family transcriptional regulator
MESPGDEQSCVDETVHGTDDLDAGTRIGLTALLVAIAAWGAIDLALDSDPWLSAHTLVEVSFVVLLLAALVYLWRGWRKDRRTLHRAELQFVASREDARLWKQRAEKLLTGLGVEIDAQFDRWSLTPAEREVALLVLKGLGHQEAAELLQRSERTIRQHATAIYRKSGLAGRAELAAFFLEDLLLPTRAPARGADQPCEPLVASSSAP